jgi:hypothetical protein
LEITIFTSIFNLANSRIFSKCLLVVDELALKLN